MTAITLKGVTAETVTASPTPGGHTPTDQQTAAVDAFRTGHPFVLEAGAGTGKTSTLRLMDAQRSGRRGVCLMYNRSAADEARRTFSPDTRCATAHSLAYQAVGKRYRDRLNGPRVPAWKAADILGIERIESGPNMRIGRNAAARLALATVARFCNSASETVTVAHVPYIEGVHPDYVQNVRQRIAGYATTAWHEIQQPTGTLRFEHDAYLKLWQLSQPVIHADYLMLDEAQDAYPAILDVVLRQTHAQLIAVGDQNQAIYSYKGSMNAIADWPCKVRLPLSQSFRFGPAVARQANQFLRMLGSTLRIEGFDRIPSRVVRGLQRPDAILCRTNAQAVAEAMNGIESGHRVAIVGGVQQVRAMARAAGDLKEGRPTDHPELCAFASWDDVQEYVEDDEAAADLRVLVQLVDRYGVGGIYRVTDAVVDERHAEVVVSTAHKSKGREWGSVLIAPDFRAPKDATELDRSEAQLMYVAVTRAKLELDCSALDWTQGWKVAK